MSGNNKQKWFLVDANFWTKQNKNKTLSKIIWNVNDVDADDESKITNLLALSWKSFSLLDSIQGIWKIPRLFPKNFKQVFWAK